MSGPRRMPVSVQAMVEIGAAETMSDSRGNHEAIHTNMRELQSAQAVLRMRKTSASVSVRAMRRHWVSAAGMLGRQSICCTGWGL
jgi:hypothetical protein